MGPFSSKCVVVDGSSYIDGGTLSSRIDLDFIVKNKDKIVIYVEPEYYTKISKIILYPFYILAGLAIMRLYGYGLGKKYIRDLFMDYSEDIEKHDNVIYLKNRFNFSSFCSDYKKLKKVYEHGKHVANKDILI